MVFTKRMSVLCLGALCVVLVLYGTVLASSPADQPDVGIQMQTVLTVQSPIPVLPGKEATVAARLTTVGGDPVSGEEVMLYVLDSPTSKDVIPPLVFRAHTDIQGIGTFLLPPEVVTDNQGVRVVFVGEHGFQPSIAVAKLDFQGPTVASRLIGGQSPVEQRTIDSQLSAAPEINNNESGVLEVESTRLKSQPEIALPPGNGSAVLARLVEDDGAPLAGEELILLTDGTPELHTHTDADGIGSFDLPPDLIEGDHNLRIVYPGSAGYEPAIAVVTLHYHAGTPSSDKSLSAASAPAPRAESPATALSGSQGTAPVAQDVGPEVILETAGAPDERLDVGGLAGPLTSLSAIQHNGSQMLAAFLAAVLPPVDNLSNLAIDLAEIPWLLVIGSTVLMALVLSPVVVAGRRRQSSHHSKSDRGWPVLRLPAIPMHVWFALRIISIGIALGLAVVLVVRPETGLFFFWRVFIPMVPMVFFVAPGLWRNVCPMAALNQTPRLFNFSLSLTPPRWLQKYSFLIAVGLFLTLVSSRKVLFNSNGLALAILIVSALSAAFLMGSIFRGKSGWCSSICPLLPVQRVYGQTPYVPVTHQHCQPCLGCTKNCYDLNPKNAYLADLHDEDRQFAAFRKFFVGLFPGFILAFYLLPNPPEIAVWEMYGLFALAGIFSAGTYFLVETALPVTSNKITVVYGALALNIYYRFNAVTLGSLIATPAPDWFVWSFRILVLGLTLAWISRTVRKEAKFIELTLAPQTIHGDFRTAGNGQSGSSNGTASVASPTVVVEPTGERITVEKNRTLLEICERHNLPIEAGCRMGLCGADPVCVHDGMEHLSKIGNDERTTLERLGLAPNTRLACMARVRGDVKIALAPEKPDIYRSSIVAGFKYDKSVEKVVIVGNGIAGVTAADHIRRRHPKCEIHLVGREPHHLYNRMGITRLIYGRSAMQGLYLLPEQWYDDFNITCWLNTYVTTVDRDNRIVTLGTGETLAYDRLILTTGGRSFVPPIEGYGMPGTFVLRTAEDAMDIRSYAQERGCRNAVVAGGGLLGLEAAYGLHKLGLSVTVLERSDSLLTRQLDARSGELLHTYLESMGIQVLMETECTAATGADSDPDARGAGNPE